MKRSFHTKNLDVPTSNVSGTWIEKPREHESQHILKRHDAPKSAYATSASKATMISSGRPRVQRQERKRMVTLKQPGMLVGWGNLSEPLGTSLPAINVERWKNITEKNEPCKRFFLNKIVAGGTRDRRFVEAERRKKMPDAKTSVSAARECLAVKHPPTIEDTNI